MNNASDTTSRYLPRKRDKWIPWYFVAFFVVLAILDSIFVSIALNTHRGVVTENSYEKGLKYNETIAAAEAQEALGWNGNIQFADRALSFKLEDANGQPIEQAKVIAYFSRAIESKSDFSVPLEYIAGGQYQQQITFPDTGKWNVTIGTTWKQQHYQKSKQLHVQ